MGRLVDSRTSASLRAAIPVLDWLLLEDGSGHLLLEDGNSLLLETSETCVYESSRTSATLLDSETEAGG